MRKSIHKESNKSFSKYIDLIIWAKFRLRLLYHYVKGVYLGTGKLLGQYEANENEFGAVNVDYIIVATCRLLSK